MMCGEGIIPSPYSCCENISKTEWICKAPMWYLVNDSARDGDGNGDGGSYGDDNVDDGDDYDGEGHIMMVIRAVMMMLVFTSMMA